MKSRRMALCSAALLAGAWGLAAAALLSSASAALMVCGTVFEWTNGVSENYSWDLVDNWDFGVGYPSSTARGAVFPDNSGTPWEVDVTTETIGQLTAEDSVDLTGDSGTSPTLTLNRMVIDATAGAVTVTFNDHMDLTAN